MRPLVASLSGWRGTARAVHWSPLLAIPVVPCLCLVAIRALIGPRGDVSLLGEWGLAFTALGAAFIADDVTFEAAPATPVGTRARLTARAALAGPAVAGGWVLVLLTYDAVAPAAVSADVADRAATGVALGAAALALATLVGKVRAVWSPGVVGVGVTACLAVASQSAPKGWLAALPPPTVLWPVAVAVAITTIAVTGREPAH